MATGDELAMSCNLIALKGLFDATNPYLQRYAAITLGKLRDLNTADALIAALKFEDAELREAIIEAIDLFNQDNNRTDQQFDAYWNIVRQTTSVLNPEFIVRLLRATQHTDASVRAGAQAAVQRMRGQTVLSFLMASESHDEGVRNLAHTKVRRLLEAQPEIVIPRLINHPAGRIGPCVDWILELGAEAVEPLISMLTIESDET
jgi:HEAT repeat protein